MHLFDLFVLINLFFLNVILCFNLIPYKNIYCFYIFFYLFKKSIVITHIVRVLCLYLIIFCFYLLWQKLKIFFLLLFSLSYNFTFINENISFFFYIYSLNLKIDLYWSSLFKKPKLWMLSHFFDFIETTFLLSYRHFFDYFFQMWRVVIFSPYYLLEVVYFLVILKIFLTLNLVNFGLMHFINVKE